MAKKKHKQHGPRKSAKRAKSAGSKRSIPLRFFARPVALLYDRGGKRYQTKFGKRCKIFSRPDRLIFTGVRVGDFIEGK